jgi:pimeloyl-ACP methyl ester carboxylesterase
MPQPFIELGGQATTSTLHMAVANGFVPQTYLPLLSPLMPHFHTVSLPVRALWGDGAPPPLQDARDWTHIAEDLLVAFEQYQLKDVLAIGHSFGGVASMIAALQKPELFRALVLLDPTFLDESIVNMLAEANKVGMSDQHPLAQGALRRKRQFDSTQAFYERYRQNNLFKTWDEEAFQMYAQYGTQPDENGGVTLTWSPEWEAFYFSIGYGAMWQTIPQMSQLKLPILIIQGAISDTYTTANYERVKTLVPNATHVQVPNHGHLFPQSAPHETSTIILEWLKRQQLFV